MSRQRYDLTSGTFRHVVLEAPCDVALVMPRCRLRSLVLVGYEDGNLEGVVLERVVLGTMVIAVDVAESKQLPMPLEVYVGTELQVDIRLQGKAAAQWVKLEVGMDLGGERCRSCHTRPRMEGTPTEGGHACDRCLQCCTCAVYRVRDRKSDAVLTQVYAADEGHALQLAYECMRGWDEDLDLETMAQRFVARRLA